MIHLTRTRLGRARCHAVEACLWLLRIRPPVGCRFTTYVLSDGSVVICTEGVDGHRYAAQVTVQRQASGALRAASEEFKTTL